MEQHNKPVCELLCIDFCNKYEEQKSTIRELEARIAALTKDAERLKCFNQIWRWKALKDGEIIYQYGEHVPALFQKTAELLPTHQPAPDKDAEPINESLAEDIECIDTRYRGDPNYEHDAYYMRNAAANLVRSGYKLYTHPPAPELKPLSLDEIHQRYKNLRVNEPPHYIDIYRDAEAALGILRGGL